VLLLIVAVLLPFSLPVINQLPIVRFIGDPDWIRLLTQAVIFAIAALGINLLSGVAGQVSLGHAFFMGVGAYTAAVLGGEGSGNLVLTLDPGGFVISHDLLFIHYVFVPPERAAQLLCWEREEIVVTS